MESYSAVHFLKKYQLKAALHIKYYNRSIKNLLKKISTEQNIA